jgi:hypothetical protein
MAVRIASSFPPQAAFVHEGLGEFLLPYYACAPRRTRTFPLQSTYEAAANIPLCNRGALDCSVGVPENNARFELWAGVGREQRFIPQ